MIASFLRQAELTPDLEHVNIYYGFPMTARKFRISDFKGQTSVVPTKAEQILFTAVIGTPLENSEKIPSETMDQELRMDTKSITPLTEQSEEPSTGICWVSGPKIAYYFFPSQSELLTLVLMGEQEKVREYWEKLHGPL